MPTLSGDVATLLGVAYTEGEPVVLYVEASEPIFTVGSTGRLGGRQKVAVDSDGTFSVTGLPSSVGGLVPLYRLVIDSRSLRLSGKTKGLTTGWFPLTQDRDLTWVVANYVEVIGVTPAVALNVAAAAALGATNDTATASFVGNSSSSTAVALAKTFVQTVSPLNHGAAGNNSTDDTTALQAAITAAATAGQPLDLRGLTYRTTTALSIPANTRLSNGTIRCTGTGVKILNITGSNVHLSRLTIQGRHGTATASNNEHGIYAAGGSSAAYLTNIRIDECTIELTGMYGIYLQFVDGFQVTRCTITRTGYTGVGTLSSQNGSIQGNRIADILASPVFASDGYGIHTSRSDEIDSLTTSPRSKDIDIRGNHVSGIPWEGIDTHGGERITIADNTVVGCKTGIAAVGADGTGNVPKYGPRQVTITGNVIDSLLTSGAAGAGIVVAGAEGASSSAAAVEYATGTVTGNTIRNHGTATDSNLGAIYARNTRGLVIAGNHLDQPSPFGICLYYDNRGVVVMGNTITDAWSMTVAAAGAVAARADNNIGTLIGNTLRRGALSATYVNARGFYNTGTGTDIIGGGATVNHFSAATTPF